MSGDRISKGGARPQALAYASISSGFDGPFDCAIGREWLQAKNSEFRVAYALPNDTMSTSRLAFDHPDLGRLGFLLATKGCPPHGITLVDEDFEARPLDVQELQKLRSLVQDPEIRTQIGDNWLVGTFTQDIDFSLRRAGVRPPT